MCRNSLLITTIVCLCAGGLFAGPVMYGGNGGHAGGQPASTNDGSLVILDQTTGTVTSVVGHPDNVARLTGIAFDSGGSLYGSTLGAIPFPPPPGPSTSDLIRINPDTGALISTVGAITEGAAGPAISMADLAIQPGTDTLYGIRAPVDGLGGAGRLYTINKRTGVATLVGDTGHFFGSIAFAPNGTLYALTADLGAQGAEINPALLTLNASNGAVLNTVTADAFYGAFGIRPDATLFVGNGDESQLFTMNPLTGVTTALSGTTGTNFVGDIDFRNVSAAAIPLPPAVLLALPGLACAALLWRRRL